jgi:repressor LexA
MNWLDNVKKIKSEKKYTNETLSAKSGISIGTLNKLLAGATEDPKLSTLIPLSEALGCSIDVMLGRQDSDNDNNSIMEKYNSLDDAGKESVRYILNKEYHRVTREKNITINDHKNISRIVKLKLYDIGVSAGTGSYLFDCDYKTISINSNRISENADFAVRVSGNSMNPKYENGDILLVAEKQPVSEGELGIFSVNGESYFKVYGNDRLISLNKDYRDIVFNENDDVRCFGKVIGKIST